MNTITVAGHLGSDPEVRFTPSGAKVTSFRIAVNAREGKEDVTIWYRITLWGDRFDNMVAHLKKGSAVIVIGELKKPEIYTDREGKNQISLEIRAEIVKFSPFGRTGQAGERAGSTSSPKREDEESGNRSYSFGSTSGGKGAEMASAVAEDDLPF